jgi:hypothetical protein
MGGVGRHSPWFDLPDDLDLFAAGVVLDRRELNEVTWRAGRLTVSTTDGAHHPPATAYFYKLTYVRAHLAALVRFEEERGDYNPLF